MNSLLEEPCKVKVRVSEIEWKTETENCDLEDGYKESLPTEVTVEVYSSLSRFREDAVNAISDKEGWLIEACYIEPLELLDMGEVEQ